MTKHVFITYATGNFIKIANSLCESALKVGFNEAKIITPEDLNKEFIVQNRQILAEKRGAGLWLWKPQIIKQELERLKNDDILVYSDTGRNYYNNFQLFPERLLKKATDHGFLLSVSMPIHGPLVKWTKRDCLVQMNMDYERVLKLPQIQAGWNFWTPCEKSFLTLDEWIRHCSDPMCITDSEETFIHKNYPEFISHRHDQAILTLLAYKNGLPHLDYSKKFFQKIINLRKASRYSQRFLTRIDDAELIERGHSFEALVSSYLDLRKLWKLNIQDGR